MALIDVIKYNASSNEFVWKFPSEDLRLGSQLIVNTAQKAIFVKGGQLFDQFDSGTHTLRSENIPVLNKLINLPFGSQSPFQAEVWYVNLITVLDNKWGTQTPIQLEDPKYKIIIPIRAFGQFGLKVENPKLLLESLVGNMREFSVSKVVDYFKGRLISSITGALASKIISEGISILEISLHLDNLSEHCTQKIQNDFNKYGLKVVDFYFMSVSFPEDDPSVIKLKQAKGLVAGVNIAGRDLYQMERTLDIMDKAAGNEGALGATIGAGLGFGLGNQIGNNNMSNTNPNLNTPPPPPIEIIQYHYILDRVQMPPKSIQEIKQLIDSGKINRETLVWKPGLLEWVKAIQISELSNLFSHIPPPLPNF